MTKKTQRQKDRRTQVLKPLLLAVLSGILLSLSFPGVEAAWLAWIAFIPLFSSLEQTSKPRAFFFAYISGCVFWGLTVYWLVHVTLLGTILLVLYLALYFGLWGGAVAWYTGRFRRRADSACVLFVCAAWVFLEYARSHLLTGFPWALVGYSQYRTLPVIQIASLTGAWGVSFLVLLVNSALYRLLSRDVAEPLRRGTERATLAVACGTVMALTLGYGYYMLSRPVPSGTMPLKVSVIQANIPQELKWNPAAQEMIVQKYFAMSRDALAHGPHLIVWPEAAVPVVVEEGSPISRRMADLAEKGKTALVAGAVTKSGGVFHNSALLFLPGKGESPRYDKLHLVPFGEYIPLKKFLPFLETIVPIGDMAAGREAVVFDASVPGTACPAGRSLFGVLICFEDVFPEISRRFVRAGAHFLVNITNDAWYKRTPAARQHFQASVFRAVENRKFLVRCANTGISGFIGPEGRIRSLVQDDRGRDIFVTGSRQEALPICPGPWTTYSVFGDWFVIACLGMLICVILWERRTVAPKP